MILHGMLFAMISLAVPARTVKISLCSIICYVFLWEDCCSRCLAFDFRSALLIEKILWRGTLRDEISYVDLE